MNDSVPPLGEGEEKLIVEKMDDKTIKKLVDSFVDRAESAYTEKYTTPEGFLEWLKGNPKLRSTFWLALSPYYDDIEKAMEVLNELRKFDAKAVERFYQLAVAFAVVWDSPDAIKSSRYTCINKVSTDQFEPLPNLLDNFKYFTDSKNIALFNFSPDKLTWPVLVHIVDIDLTPDEIEWCLKNYNKRQLIGTFYDSIKYDYGKAGDETPKLGNNKYNLKNLLKFGGICGDQAYLASRLGKLFGVPSMKVEGTGRTGVGHAWVGYMDMKNDRLELAFTGRFFNDFYYTGDIFDPQTRTKILDSEVDMLYDGVNSNYNKYINSVTLVHMAQGLIADKPEVSINLTINALQQNLFCAPAWVTLMEHVKKCTLEPSRSIIWFNQMMTSLKKHPDILMLGLASFMECIPKDNYQKRDTNYQTASQIFKTAKRPDLLIRLNLIQGDELCVRGQENQALNVYMDSAYANAGEGNLILPLLEKASELSRKLNKVKETILNYEKIIQKMPHFRDNKISKSYQDTAKLLVEMYENVNMTDKADKLCKIAQLEEFIHLVSGIEFINKDEYEKAIAELTEAIKLDPKLALAYNNRGEAYRRKGEFDKALEDFNEAIRLNPKYDEAYTNRANVYINNGDFERAIEDYNEAISLTPKFALAYNNRGFAYYNTGELDKAIEDYNEAIKLNPKFAGAYDNRGDIYANKGELDKAIADYNEAIRLSPKLVGAYNNRGNVYVNKGNLDKAIADYNAVISLNPKFAGAYYNRGIAYYNKGELDKAIADYNETIKLSPKLDKAYTNRGCAYTSKGELDKAIADYNEAIKLNPKYFLAYNNRGNAYSNKGELDKAIEDYNEAIRLSTKDASAYTNRGIAYGIKGELDKAIEDFDEAIRLNPKLAEAYYNRGFAYYKKDELNKAIEDFNEAIKLNPKDAEVYYNRGNAYANKAERESSQGGINSALYRELINKVITDFTETIKLNPKYAEAYNDRGIAYSKKGEFDKAIADGEMFLKLASNHPDAAKIRQLIEEWRSKLK